MTPFTLQLIKIPGVTLGVEEVPVGQDRFVWVPHNNHTSSLESADVILKDNIESCLKSEEDLLLIDKITVIQFTIMEITIIQSTIMEIMMITSYNLPPRKSVMLVR